MGRDESAANSFTATALNAASATPTAATATGMTAAAVPCKRGDPIHEQHH
jgi:hypothetical protein